MNILWLVGGVAIGLSIGFGFLMWWASGVDWTR